MYSEKDRSFEEFLEDFFNIYPKGNPKKAYTEVCYVLYKKQKKLDGTPITYEYLRDQWKKYIDVCIKTKKDEKYIKELKNWITSEDYLVNYDAKITPLSKLIKRRPRNK